MCKSLSEEYVQYLHPNASFDDGFERVARELGIRALRRIVEVERIRSDGGRVEAALDELELLLLEGSRQRHLLLHAHEARTSVRGEVLGAVSEQLSALLRIEHTVAACKCDCSHATLAVEPCNTL